MNDGDDDNGLGPQLLVGEGGMVGLLASIPGFCFFHFVRLF